MSLVAGRGPLSSDPSGWFAPSIPADLDIGIYIEPHPRRIQALRDGQVVIDSEQALLVHRRNHQLSYAFPADAVNPPNPYHRVDCRPTKRRLHVTIGDTDLVNTADTVIVFETALTPRLYVEPAQVRTDLLQKSETETYCNYKGVATYWSAVLGDTVTRDVAWSYDDPPPESLPVKGFFSFDDARIQVVAELP
ncbi:hypothetical protein MSIMFI_00964 [Mycobacterium simulans]|uniref:DUF427 domain-containing protein n=1 Tax=Mycobacterium simulans TaxID=627089 RepID=UPI00174AB6F7|nr:DUF427 domain-containing protein [Mycobacterium simulans]SON59480.1 hypothetical protein MSIMFI_00964 [Mycobacterium simulans]